MGGEAVVGTRGTVRGAGAGAGRLVGQQQLLREVWGPAYATETNYLRVYLAQLRRKLEPDPAHPVHPITEPGMGYRFEVREQRRPPGRAEAAR